MTIYKDIFISIGFVVTVFIVQLGFFNSCWCRSGALISPTNTLVDLNGLSNEDWVSGWLLWSFTPGVALLIIAVFIFWAGADGDEARALLNRNLNTRQQDIIHINRLRLELPVEPVDKPPRRLQQILNRLAPRRASNLQESAAYDRLSPHYGSRSGRNPLLGTRNSYDVSDNGDNITPIPPHVQ
jgi:hypothetical protein